MVYEEGIEIKPDTHVGLLFLFPSVMANKIYKLLLKIRPVRFFFPVKFKKESKIIGNLCQ